jgi:DNA-binding cell septation regulator SpoVG
LPAVQASGISLKVQDEPGGKKFTLSRGAADKSTFDSITVVAQMNRNVVYEVDIAFEAYPSIVGHLLTDSLPSGILQMTVFDKYGTPIAERLTFVDNNEYRDAGSIAISKSGLGKREENIFEIQFPNAVQRSMSVAVTDYNGSQWPDVGNIESSILLADNLKDYVWDAGWYFKNKNESTVKALDNLLLTQKLNNFDWSEIFKNPSVVEKFVEQHFIKISGLVVDDKTKAPLSGGKLSLLLEAGESTRTGFEVPVGKDGKFLIDSVYFSGKGKVFYGYTNSKGKSTSALLIPDEDRLSKVAVEIPVDFVNSFVVHPLETVKGNDGLDTRFQFVQSKMGEVNETQKDLSEKKREKSPTETVNDQYTTGVFRGDAKETIDNINHPSTDKTMNGVDFVKNRIQQIELSGGGFVNRKNMSINTGRKWAVGIFINEAPASLTLLQNIIAKDIALVKFYEAGFVGVGSGFPGGAVAVYTKVQENEQKRADDLPFLNQSVILLLKIS